jgi:hypothetical protein
MKNLFFSSVCVLVTTFFSLAQNKISFYNDKVIYFESLNDSTINHNITDNETQYFSEHDSYGFYSVDLNEQKLSLKYNDENYNWKILENKIEDGFLYLKVFEGLNENKKEMISYYRINLDSNSDKQFVYKTFDFERNITWGIYSKEINSLICR